MVVVRADRGDGSCGRVVLRTGASSELLTGAGIFPLDGSQRLSPFVLILRTAIGRGVAARTGIVLVAVEVVAANSVVVDDSSGRGGVAIDPGVAYRAISSSLELGLMWQRVTAVVVGRGIVAVDVVAADVVAPDVVFRLERPRFAL